jgi:hypothetical protein
MKDKQIRHERELLRGIGPKKTLAFVVCVEIVKNEEDDGYSSTILPLEEGTVIGAGKTPDQAEADALALFREMVDHCIAKDTLEKFLGDSGIMQAIPLDLDAARKALDQIRARQKHPEPKSVQHERWFGDYPGLGDAQPAAA